MTTTNHEQAKSILEHLCLTIPGRSVGSEGNLMASRYFREQLIHQGWETRELKFDAMDWHTDGALILTECDEIEAYSSPYANGCDETAPLLAVSSVDELEAADARGCILLLHGEIAAEQLMPRNFVFYNPESHQRIISALDHSGAVALICATDRNAALAGGVYPFPLIEDGDFDIPSVYLTDEKAAALMPLAGRNIRLISGCRRIPAAGYNVSGFKGMAGQPRMVVSAHIDAKKGTPGAIDNATGVCVLLLLAAMLRDYSGNYRIELLAFNGEDYYAVPGQMQWLSDNQTVMNEIALNINIDGLGYREGRTAFSPFGLSDKQHQALRVLIDSDGDFCEGSPWPQGDHSIFVQYGIPAIAVSSEWFVNHIADQQITHTPADNLSIVDTDKVVAAARALHRLILSL